MYEDASIQHFFTVQFHHLESEKKFRAFYDFAPPSANGKKSQVRGLTLALLETMSTFPITLK